jgi:hypothetical protein
VRLKIYSRQKQSQWKTASHRVKNEMTWKRWTRKSNKLLNFLYCQRIKHTHSEARLSYALLGVWKEEWHNSLPSTQSFFPIRTLNNTERCMRNMYKSSTDRSLWICCVCVCVNWQQQSTEISFPAKKNEEIWESREDCIIVWFMDFSTFATDDNRKKVECIKMKKRKLWKCSNCFPDETIKMFFFLSSCLLPYARVCGAFILFPIYQQNISTDCNVFIVHVWSFELLIMVFFHSKCA